MVHADDDDDDTLIFYTIGQADRACGMGFS